MSFRPPPYRGYGHYYYSYVQDGTHRTIIIDEDSNVPFDNTRPTHYYSYSGYTNDYGHTNSYTNYDDANTENRLAAQQPFPNYRPFMGNSFFNSNGWHQPGWHQPDIPWKGPKEFVIDPNEFNNLELIVSGSAHGNLLVTRSSNNTSSIKVKTQILLSDEILQDKVEILVSDDSPNYILQVKTPEFCGFPNCVLTNIDITFPRDLKGFGKFSINVINLNINDDDLKNITFDNVDWKLNPSINVKGLKSREISVKSRGQISGNYYIDDSLLLETSNSQINATTNSFSDSTPKSIKLVTSNAAIRGSFPLALLFKAHTSNSGIDLNIARASQNNSGKIILGTSNGKINGVYDVDGEWHASTSNGNINAKLNLVNSSELVRISGMTSNGKINTLVSDSYKGRFNLQTSNGKSAIERSHDQINYNVNTSSSKSGYKGENNNNELTLRSSNGKIDLEFF
ncbi:unnamed protein product [Rhizophagus irregularis]|uniref:Adhesin domain-containing protein n=1 Tax=Rhizophagus irregularis TaxID=588596 RepID=A0A2N1NSM4_9GLOM|nr:hypothetical protein RhiirC2_733139 [Rhizophagus irregularis]CAB4396911.1 unnamed protein product [Rhizophagus irregularis]CAB5368002.1 unnamed protein product [Rhizophagus irregularis]